MDEKETVAFWMMAHGFSTGHGDTVADMLIELACQIDERVARAIDAEREVCVKMCEQVTRDGAPAAYECAAAIRKRGEK